MARHLSTLKRSWLYLQGSEGRGQSPRNIPHDRLWAGFHWHLQNIGTPCLASCGPSHRCQMHPWKVQIGIPMKEVNPIWKRPIWKKSSRFESNASLNNQSWEPTESHCILQWGSLPSNETPTKHHIRWYPLPAWYHMISLQCRNWLDLATADNGTWTQIAFKMDSLGFLWNPKVPVETPSDFGWEPYGGISVGSLAGSIRNLRGPSPAEIPCKIYGRPWMYPYEIPCELNLLETFGILVKCSWNPFKSRWKPSVLPWMPTEIRSKICWKL